LLSNQTEAPNVTQAVLKRQRRARLDDKRHRHWLGAHTLARDAAGGVGDIKAEGRPMIRSE